MLNGAEIIDLFAGPGGLGEGFSSITDQNGEPAFRIKISIEKDIFAHETLLLRAFFRQFGKNNAPEEYYQYLRGETLKSSLFDKFPEQYKQAQNEALCIELGSENYNRSSLNRTIRKQLSSDKYTVLIGGPPCQAYSLMGRAVMKRVRGKSFEQDPRHTLYKEYLKVILDHKPHVFVMENVKGILSSKLNDEAIFPQILKDLKDPKKALNGKGDPVKYNIYSLSKNGKESELLPKDYLIQAEKYGVPQARHRVILLGVRSDIKNQPKILKNRKMVNIEDVIGDLPKLRSGISRAKENNLEAWRKEIQGISQLSAWSEIEKNILKSILKNTYTQGEKYTSCSSKPKYSDWYIDKKLGGVTDHISRNHMIEDLARYFFVSRYAEIHESSPHLQDFPKSLLPNHKNALEAHHGNGIFSDRFKVQRRALPSSTITSHISKDGHYFIHYDSEQIRSLTVREAARIQTFPDNYKFEGPRTAQYHQVGNAVPPLLAKQIGQIVLDLLERDCSNP